MPRRSTTNGSSRSRRDVEADLDITPMIDVTFLLLIFFMVASTMQAQRTLNLPTARHGEGVPAASCCEIVILAPHSTAESPRILLGGLEGTEGTVDDVRPFVEQSVREGMSEVVVKADRDVTTGFVQRVLKAVSEVEGVQFSIGVEDERAANAAK